MIYTPRIASEVFETSVMKTDEVVLFVQSATENGSDLETAYEDMRMIDDMLHMSKMHIALGMNIRRTRSGNLRKGTSLYDAYSGIIESRIQNDKEI